MLGKCRTFASSNKKQRAGRYPAPLNNRARRTPGTIKQPRRAGCPVTLNFLFYEYSFYNPFRYCSR